MNNQGWTNTIADTVHRLIIEIQERVVSSQIATNESQKEPPMTELLTPSGKLQWKWVGITFIFYVLLYLMPLVIMFEFFPSLLVLSGIWIFGGIVIVAALAGYLSEGVTIWEPAIAGAGLIVLLLGYIALAVFPTAFRGAFFRGVIFVVIPAAIVFVLSLTGAWLGERAQQFWKDKTPGTL